MADESNLNNEDDLPVVRRRKRRDSSSPTSLQASSFKSQLASTQPHGISTPPATPHRSKKRVKFSDPGPSSSTGLTPLFSRNFLLTPPKPKSYELASPSLQSSSRLDSSFKVLQFGPYREILDGRAKRRLRRNGLSEVTNAHESDERLEKKARKMKLERLQEDVLQKDEQIRQKDAEIAYLKDRQNIESLPRVECNERITFTPTKDREVDTEMSDISHGSNYLLPSPFSLGTLLSPWSESAENNETESTNTFVGEIALREQAVEENSIEDDGAEDTSRQLAFNSGIAMRLLLGRGRRNIGTKSQSLWLLLQASEKGDEEAVQSLLDQCDIDLNDLREYSHTPLIIAAKKGREAVAQILLTQKGIAPDLEDSKGYTALWHAANNGHHGVVQQLLALSYVDRETSGFSGNSHHC